MNRASTLGILRHILTAIGGALFARGTMTEADASEAIGAIITLVGVIWSVVEKNRRSPAGTAPQSGGSGTMAVLLLLGGAFLLSVSGCANFHTVQRDVSVAPDGTRREIETRATARTLAAGKQTLANWKASQTDKTQGASVGDIGQESDATKLTEALGSVMMRALVAGSTGGASMLAPSPAPAARPADNPSVPQLLVPDGMILVPAPKTADAK